ncbi:MAG: TonB-dependent receptor plug domain-containing protein [Owenweeksia sp.]|nr:TonB-dependent receptor plug domain-containing protein [Owenweeksia sp.]
MTLSDVIEGLSGVTTLESGNSIVKPVIHGLYGNRVVTTNNGIRQEDQQWGLEHGLNIDLNTAENLAVIKGAAAAQYGPGALGGVLKIEPAPLPYGKEKSGQAGITMQSNGRGGSLRGKLQEGTLQNFAYRAQFSHKRLGDLQAPDYATQQHGYCRTQWLCRSRV